ncbi:MAG TPA: hypothetical protein PLJ12_01510 [Planctomycetota bacterium]|nr:hypothetical protein [Planctomycetota bacterium]
MAPAQTPLQAKQVAAEPTDIVSGRVRLPERRELAETIRGSLVEAGADGHLRAAGLWVPDGEVSLVPIWTDAAQQHVQLRWNRGPWEPWAHFAALGLGEVEGLAPVDEWTAMAPERFELRTPSAGWLSLRDDRDAPTYFLVGDSVTTTLHHGLSSYATVQGEDLALLAWLEGETATIVSASVELETTGQQTILPLEDSGLALDGQRGDGVFGLRLPKDWVGPTTAWTRIEARTPDGRRFTRIGRQEFEIFAPVVEFAGTPSLDTAEPGLWTLRLPTWIADPEQRLHLAAEVWATAADGSLQPACWLARACERLTLPGQVELPLALDLRWLQRAGLGEPLELRNVRVQTMDGWSVLAQRAAWPVPVSGAPLSVGPTSDDLHFRLTGTTVAPLLALPPAGAASDVSDQALFGLMLVHGWCSGGGVWPTSQFDGPLLVFNDPNANRTHDEFAQLLGQLGGQNRSFGGIGHSQGGCALLHLRTYYASGLDRASGGRVIQSLASPYQGTPLASLGFFLCGVNQDLTPSGSGAWLANIPTVTRADVFYYSTSNSGSACQFATDFFLSNPEDGVVEMSRAQLPGATNMGHVTGWCHTTGMSNPAGYNDAARNAVMNQAAAR